MNHIKILLTLIFIVSAISCFDETVLMYSIIKKEFLSENIDKTVIEQIAENVSRVVVVESDVEINNLIEELRAQNSATIKSIKNLGKIK